jgi:predicted lipoprotein
VISDHVRHKVEYMSLGTNFNENMLNELMKVLPQATFYGYTKEVRGLEYL